MISKNRLKYLTSLKIKKHRNKANQVLIEGVRLIDESIKAGADIEFLYCTNQFMADYSDREFVKMIESSHIPIDKINNNDMDQLADSINHQGIIGLANIKVGNYKEQLECDNQLILDSISDPGNLGNILRTSDWFGLKNIYLSDDCADPYNSKVIRSAMGAHFYIDIFQLDIVQHIQYLKENNFVIIAADLDGESIYDYNIPQKSAIILGNEAHGISDEICKLIDCKITIPKLGSIESLNVAMATGIILSHLNK